MAFGSGDNLGMGIVFSLTDAFSNKAGNIGSSFNKLNQTVNAGVTKINQNLQALTAGFLTTILTITGLLAPFGFAIAASANFEAIISEVGAKSQASSVQLDELRKQSLALGEDTVFSAKEVAKGQVFLAQAGFQVQEIMDALPGTLNLAAAGNINLARSADIASNTLAQFQLPAREMARVADVIANAAINSNQNVEQFAQGMKFLGPTASALKIPIEEAAASMMALSNAGLQGSIGTRALGTSLVARLTGSIKAAKDEMNAIGLSVFDATGKFVGLNETVRRVQQATRHMTDQQRVATLTTIFGAESIQEITTLMQAQVKVFRDGREVILRGADALEHFTKQNENAAGTAERVANELLNNLKGDFILFQSVFQTTMTQIGAALTPILRPIVQLFTKLLGLVNKLIQTKLGQWIVRVAAAVAMLISGFIVWSFVSGTLVPILGAIVTELIAIAVAAAPAIAGILPFVAIAALIAAPLILAAIAVNKFNKVMKGTDEPATGFLGVLQKIGGVIKASIQIFKSWNGETFALSKGMRDSLDKMGILQFVLNLGTWIVRIKSFVSGFLSVFKDISKELKPVFEEVKNMFNKFLDSVFALFGIEVDKNESSLEKWTKAGKLLASVFVGVILPVIRFVISAFMTFGLLAIGLITRFKELGNFLTNFASGLWNLGAFIVDQIGKGLKSAWNGLIILVKGLLSALPFGGSILSFLGLSDDADINANVQGVARSPRLDNLAQNITVANATAAQNETVTVQNTKETVRDTKVVVEIDSQEISSRVIDQIELDEARQ